MTQARRYSDLPPGVLPRFLTRDAAAEYCGCGGTKFDELVRDGRLPAAARIDSMVRWDLKKLDRALDALSNPEGNPWDS